MVKDQLRIMLNEAVTKILPDGAEPLSSEQEIHIDTTPDITMGDYATNLAMTLPKVLRKPPRDIATQIIENLPEHEMLAKTEIAGPGFINFHLNREWIQSNWYAEILTEVQSRGSAYGIKREKTGPRIQVEFVSANPVGPLVIVSARAASFGNALAFTLAAAGSEVEREFYVNDAGVQVRVFAESINARMLELAGLPFEFLEHYYRGKYVKDLAAEIMAGNKDLLEMSEEDRLARLMDIGIERMLAHQKSDLEEFRVEFENWFREHVIHESNEVQAALEKMTANGHTYEEEGAVWFCSTKFGDEKDRVLRKADGTFTYFLADIAYHANKFERGFDKVIDIWGPDHHGHVIRMKCAMEAMGYDPDRLHIIILQQVRLIRDGQEVKMSKREGQFETMMDLVDEVGVDAAKYFFLMRKADSHLDFDLTLAVQESSENPVYYVQYAHARICSILRHGEEQGIKMVDIAPDTSLLNEDEALEVIKLLADYPEIIQSAAAALEPHRILNHMYTLAGAFHRYYKNNKVIDPDNPSLTQARLALIYAVRTVVSNGLHIMGISAPEKMFKEPESESL